MENKPIINEKRKFERVEIPGVKASYKLLDPRTWSTYHNKTQEPIQNISLGGLALKTTNLLEIKAPVGIDLKLNSEHEPIRAFGRVAWIKRIDEKDDYLMGISFSFWNRDEDKKAVYELIKRNMS